LTEYRRQTTIIRLLIGVFVACGVAVPGRSAQSSLDAGACVTCLALQVNLPGVPDSAPQPGTLTELAIVIRPVSEGWERLIPAVEHIVAAGGRPGLVMSADAIAPADVLRQMAIVILEAPSPGPPDAQIFA